MKVYVCGFNGDAPCVVLELAACTVALDAAAEPLATLLHTPRWARQAPHRLTAPPRLAAPRTALAPASLDALLISSARQALALPALVAAGFRGRALATTPTVELVRQLLSALRDALRAAAPDYAPSPDAQEWSQMVANALAAARSRGQPLSGVDAHLLAAHEWHEMPGAAVIDTALARLEPVAYRQTVALGGGVSATPCASGTSLGSAGWLLEADGARVAYLADASLGTSRHPAPLDLTPLKRADALLLAHVVPSTPAGAAPIHTIESGLPHLCASVEGVVRGGGCVLLPMPVSGLAFDIIEPLERHLRSRNLHAPLVLLSTAAKHSVAYANIAAEWMGDSQQARSQAADPPFAFEEMRRRHALYVFDTLEDAERGLGGALLCSRGELGFQCDAPSYIVLAGDSTLRFGASLQLMQMWRDEPKNAVIVVEPETASNIANTALLSPFRPMRMQSFVCALEPRLRIADARRVLSELAPRRLLAPTRLARRLGPQRIPLFALAHADVLHIPLEPSATLAYLSAPLAATLEPQALSPADARALSKDVDALTRDALGDDISALAREALAAAIRVAPFTARAVDRDDVLHLLPAPETSVKDSNSNNTTLFSAPNVDALVDALVRDYQCGPIQVEPDDLESDEDSQSKDEQSEKRRKIVRVDALSATIELYGDSTIVECNGSAEDRKILLDCLQKASSSATR